MCAIGVVETERKRALLLHILGKEIQQKVKALGDNQNLNPNEQEDSYEKVKRQLRVLFAPKTRPVFERNVFHSMGMKDRDEDVVEFVSRLKKQAQRCQLGEAEGEDMIRDVVIAKCPYPALQVRLLEADSLGLAQVIKMWQSHLQVREQAAKLQNMSVKEKEVKEKEEVTKEEAKPEEVCRVGPSRASQWKQRWVPTKRRDDRQDPAEKWNSDERQPLICFRCGEEGHKASRCYEARGKTCSRCGGKNHLAKACRSKMEKWTSGRGQRHGGQVNQVTEDVEDDFVFSTTQGPQESKMVTVFLDKQPVKVMVDTGASVDIITRKDFQTLKGIQVRKSNRRLLPYGTDIPLALDGQFVATTSTSCKQIEACWVIAAKGNVSLLSGTTLREKIRLGYLKCCKTL